MKCLSDVQLQSLVDGEATDDLRYHVEACARCADRVRERERVTADVLRAIEIDAQIPPEVSRRIETALVDGSRQGATRLRIATPSAPWRRAAWSTGAVAAGTLVVVFGILPLFKGPSTVSASEILARSANRLAQTGTTGVEILDYELTLDGVPREMMPDHRDGTYRMRQVIDHDRPGRYFVATYDSSGVLLSSVSQDPVRSSRSLTLRIDKQLYRFECQVPGDMAFSPPELERLHMEATVAIMQASGNQLLQIIDGTSGRQYRIEVPRLTGQATNAVWDLSEAAVVIDASDYHIVELAVKGTFLKHAYSVSYRLISRALADSATIDGRQFDVPPDPAAIVINGEGSAIPARDALVLALRELARVKQER